MKPQCSVCLSNRRHIVFLCGWSSGGYTEVSGLGSDCTTLRSAGKKNSNKKIMKWLFSSDEQKSVWKAKKSPPKKFKLTKGEIPSPPPMGDDTCSLWSWGSRVSHLSLLGRLLSSWSHKFRKVTCKNPAKTTEVARRKFNTIWFEFKHFSLSITLLVRSRKPGWPLMSLGRLKDRLLVRTVHCLTGRYCRTS